MNSEEEHSITLGVESLSVAESDLAQLPFYGEEVLEISPRSGSTDTISHDGQRVPLWEMLGHQRPEEQVPRQRRLPALEIPVPAFPMEPHEEPATTYGPTFRFRAPHIAYEDDPITTFACLCTELAGPISCHCSVVDLEVDGTVVEVALANPACDQAGHPDGTTVLESSEDVPNIYFERDNKWRLICRGMYQGASEETAEEETPKCYLEDSESSPEGSNYRYDRATLWNLKDSPMAQSFPQSDIPDFLCKIPAYEKKQEKEGFKLSALAKEFVPSSART